jgi:hypothetical protein
MLAVVGLGFKDGGLPSACTTADGDVDDNAAAKSKSIIFFEWM